VSRGGWFLTYGAGHPHSLARAPAKGYRGLNEKIAPVSVKSLTAGLQSKA
jgi:hypothetical protein